MASRFAGDRHGLAWLGCACHAAGVVLVPGARDALPARLRQLQRRRGRPAAQPTRSCDAASAAAHARRGMHTMYRGCIAAHTAAHRVCVRVRVCDSSRSAAPWRRLRNRATATRSLCASTRSTMRVRAPPDRAARRVDGGSDGRARLPRSYDRGCGGICSGRGVCGGGLRCAFSLAFCSRDCRFAHPLSSQALRRTTSRSMSLSRSRRRRRRRRPRPRPSREELWETLQPADYPTDLTAEVGANPRSSYHLCLRM